MTGSLAGKTVLITGSTDGLGKLVAQHLAMQDAVALLHGRNMTDSSPTNKVKQH